MNWNVRSPALPFGPGPASALDRGHSRESPLIRFLSRRLSPLGPRQPATDPRDEYTVTAQPESVIHLIFFVCVPFLASRVSSTP